MDAALYDEHARYERHHWWFLGRRAIVEHLLRRFLPPQDRPRRILDVGCGTGGMFPLLRRFGTVEGVESEPVAVARCRDAFGFDARLGRIPDDVPADGSFDVACAFDVIEHIDDDLAACIALRDAVRPGGTVVVTVPAMPSLWSDHDDRNGHKRRYTRSALLEVIGRAGLRVEHASYFNTALLPAVAGARLAQRVRPPASPRSDFTMPSPTVNRLLTRVFASERAAVAGPGLPLGVSLAAVATRTGDR